MSKKDYDLRINNAKSKTSKVLWQNAKIEFILQSRNFSNPQKGLEKSTLEELNEIVPLLKSSLEYRPTLRDFNRWLKAVRNDIFTIDLETAKNFIKFIDDILSKSNENVLLHTEVSYYLYCLQAIQIINAGTSIDKSPIKKMQNALSFCKSKAEMLTLNKRSSFEWLGNNRKDGFEQLVSKDKLGDIFAKNDFFEDTTLLREVTGTIQSGSIRQTGEIRLDNCELTAFFVPIHGGYIINKDNSIEKCKFDNTNNVNTRVKFYIGFSYGGLRAWQPIPEYATRANSSQKENKVIPKQATSNEIGIKVKVTDVHKFHKKLFGKIEGEIKLIDIPFEEGKNYEDYKSWRGQVIFVSLSENGKYKIVKNN